MNKLSGYSEVTLKSGRHVEFKISNGSYAIYAKMQGFTTYDQVVASLQPPTQEVDGVQVPYQTFEYIESMRNFIFACAKYAAIAQNKPVDFTVYDVEEWLEEIGTDLILGAVDEAPEVAEESKKKTKKRPLIRASQ